MTLSDTQIAQVAANAGFTGEALVTAIAIALAESSGNAGNTSGDGGTSWGLWQIHWTVHPQFDRNQLLDPNYNAAAAYQLSGGGTSFYPWSTWRFGQYRNYINRARTAAASIGAGAAPVVEADTSGDVYSDFNPASIGSDTMLLALAAGGLILLILLSSK